MIRDLSTQSFISLQIVFYSQLEGFQTVAVDDILLGKQGEIDSMQISI